MKKQNLDKQSSVRRGRRTIWLAISVLLFVFGVGQARSAGLTSEMNVFFERLSTEDGLSHNSVTTVYQDSHGYIWLGTQEGLNRYNGYHFQTFFHISDDRRSLTNDWIWDILEDDRGTIWIGTDNGLDFYVPRTQTFSEYRSKSSTHDRIEGSVRVLYEDRSGNMWIGGSAGLSQLHRDGTITHYVHDENNPQSLGGGTVHAILEDKNGRLWVGTQEGGLVVLDRESGAFQKYPSAIGSNVELGSDYIRSLMEDANGQIWVGTADRGLAILDPTSNDIVRFQHDPKNQYSLSSDRINEVFQDRNGLVWIGTSQGLDLWEPATREFHRYTIEFSDKDSIATRDVYDLFEDAGGVIWAATYDGVSKWNSAIHYFAHFKRRATDPHPLSSDSVWSFSEDAAGNIWIGTFGGVNRRDRDTGEFTHIVAGERGLGSNRVVSMLHDREGGFWLGTVDSGLYVMPPGETQFKAFRHSAKDLSSISDDAITRIYEDSRGRIWVATYGSGLNRFVRDGRFMRYPINQNEGYRFSDLRVVDIREDPDGMLWLATDGGGVTILDPMSGRTSQLRHSKDDSRSLSSDEAIALLWTDEGMWVGTRNEGLSRFDRSRQNFDRFGKQDGLASNAVYGLLEDETGRLWVSGGQGLSVLTPETGQVQVYDSAHGLQSDDFNFGAVYKTREGTFLFGGNNGFNAFDPLRISSNQYVPDVQLTRFTKSNADFDVGVPAYDIKSIELNYDDYVVGFEFAAMDFTAPSKNRYRYMLKGFDRDWVDTQGTHQATYTNLPSGHYTFRVQGSNNDGVWNTDGLSIKVTVHPPIWLTWWAYAIYTLVACALVYWLWQAQKERVRREAEKRYNARLQLYIESLEEASDCVLIADADQRLLYANRAVRDVMGIDPELARDHSLMELIFSSAKDGTRAKTGLAARGRWHGEVQNWRDDQEYTAEVTLASVKDPEEFTVAYVSIARDVTDRKRTERELDNYRRNLEERVEERTEALSREIAEHKAARRDLANSLKEKELLLKEVHHRVKNNMQIISSLLNIQAESIGDPTFTTLLGESQQRIKSMSLIHENLYQSESLLEIGFRDYIHSLAGSLCRLYVIPGVQVLLDVDVDDINLDIDTAVPCGLIINELITNALKHAFKDHTGEGHIAVQFKRWDNGYELTISDDGRGMPVNFDVLKSQTMGMEIVSILTEQLEGEIEFIREGGSTFRIRFPHHEVTVKQKGQSEAR